jgi:hypothetical protein
MISFVSHYIRVQKNPNTDGKPTRVLSSLVLLGAVAHETRRLDAYGEEVGGEGDGMILGSEAMIASFEQCGIDLNEIMNAAIMMGGLDGQGSLAPGDIFTMLAEKGEQDCSAEQEAQYGQAITSFIACAGEKCGVMF